MDELIEMRFPLAGIDLSGPFFRQSPRAMERVGEYGRTTASGTNVRSFDVEGKMRGGSRPGLSKYVAQAVGDVPSWIVQHLNVIVTVQ